MAHRYNKKLPHKKGYPGEGYYYVLCDVCGVKLRAKDAVLITSKYNLLSRMVVCKDDADKTNPQQYIKAFRERQIDNPVMIRSEGADRFTFIDTPSQIDGGDTSDPTGRASDPPRFLTILSVTATQIELQWLGAEDPGSTGPVGYLIERESPVGGGFSTIQANTNSVAQYYKDTTASASTVYNYRVSAINATGTSDPSNEADATTSAS